jgi:nitrate reductase (NAD(P)H)
MDEVAQHASEESAWFVHEGRVYDATPFLGEHPGGAESILISAGMDATDEFNGIHSTKAKGLLAQYYIGDLATGKAAAAGGAIAVVASGVAAVTPPKIASHALPDLVALNPREKQTFRLAEKISLSHNVRLFRFALQSPEHRFGLPVGKHVFLYATINGENVVRAYTPTSSDDDLGHFDLVIKVYWANENPRFPEGGKMSQHLETLAVGDAIEVKGPLGHFVYLGRGAYANGKVKATAKRISLIAGGTGITPCYQVIKAVLKDGGDGTQLALLYANQSEDDILIREVRPCLNLFESFELF